MSMKIKGRKEYSILAPDVYSMERESGLDVQTEEFSWSDSICDLSDFVPLAELVRSFKPQDSTVEPEFEYPDGQAPEGYDPPAEYDDITDVYEVVTAKKEELQAKLDDSVKKSRQRKSADVPAVPESDNASSPQAKLSSAAETALGEKKGEVKA